MLRNDLPAENGFVALRLVGTKSNRDAIGARVSVHPDGGKALPLVKTLRAGDGFLSQSSKWLHFGLGGHGGAVTVEVRWPSGGVERFPGLASASFHLLREGQGQAELVQGGRAGGAEALESGPVSSPAGLPAGRTISLSRIPVPQIDAIPGKMDKPLLVTLWASWCSPCVAELEELTRSEADLRRAGCDVLALSVDTITPDGDEAAARRLLRKLKVPYRTAFATEATIEKLQMVHDLLFDIYTELPLPAGFLLDQGGNLAVFYRGRVEVERLLLDVEMLSASDTQRRESGQLFEGRWFAPPRRLSCFPIGLKLLQRGFDQEALRYYEQNKGGFAAHPHYQRMLVPLGDSALRQGNSRGALRAYEAALERSGGRDYRALQAAAWLLATDRDDAIRDGPRALAYAEAASGRVTDKDAVTLDVLAAAYAEMERFPEAVRAMDAALELLGQEGEEELLREGSARRALYLQRKKFRRQD